MTYTKTTETKTTEIEVAEVNAARNMSRIGLIENNGKASAINISKERGTEKERGAYRRSLLQTTASWEMHMPESGTGSQPAFRGENR